MHVGVWMTEAGRSLLDSLEQCVVIHDGETFAIRWANVAACTVLEFSVAELQTLKAPDMSSPQAPYHRAAGRAWLSSAVRHGKSRTTWRYRSKSGREFTTDALATRLGVGHDTVVMVQFRDVERQRHLERTLRETEESLHVLSRHTSTGLLVLAADGSVEFASDGAMALLRRIEPRESAVNIDDLCALDGICTWNDLLNSQDSRRSVRAQVLNDGTHDRDRWVAGTLEKVATEDGELRLLTLHDISTLVEADTHVARRLDAENQLARLTAMGDMGMVIAHELSQPLAAASNFLAGAVSRLDPDDEAASPLHFGLTSADRQIAQARAVINAVRTYVGTLETRERAYDLVEILRERLYFIELRARESKVRLVVDLPAIPIRVRCERVLVGQVMLNLAFNAIDEVRQSPTSSRLVTVAVGAAPPSGQFVVRDNGRGLRSPAESVFDQGFTSKSQGVGLGLTLSWRIITRQGGSIYAKNLEPVGAELGFHLPLE